ncbi:uncharacterized protein LOC134239178 [Saccostrea cucullata]|uniref:uncharacterized protein LOC134239178 n=1 Tax=Saccostrea cuccullata TaxID=36930 RepID=UPI002ECFBC15
MNNVCNIKDKLLCDLLADPYSFWDKIPCPPPSNPQILFQVDYKRLLSDEDGLRIIFRIAKRCDIPIPEMLKSPARLGGNAIFTFCDSECVNTVVFSCLIFFVVMVIIVIYVIRYQSRQKTVSIVTYRSRDRCICIHLDGEKETNSSCNGNCRYNYGKYTKTGSIPRRNPKYSDHSDQSPLESTYKQFPCVDVFDSHCSPLQCNEKSGSENYEDLEKQKSRIDEFTLLRKAFKKYYGRDIDFAESPYSRKTEETYACGSENDMEMTSLDSDESPKSTGKRSNYDFDENFQSENHYNDIDCDLMINEVNLSNSTYSFNNTTNHIYATIKKSVFETTRPSLLNEPYTSSTLKSIYSDDSDCEDNLLEGNSYRSSGIDFQRLHSKHVYERMTSNTSNRTDLSFLTEDSVELLVPDRNSQCSTFK